MKQAYKSTIERLLPLWAYDEVCKHHKHLRRAVDLLAELCAAICEYYGPVDGPAVVTSYAIAKGVYVRGYTFSELLRDFCTLSAEPSAEELEAFEELAAVFIDEINTLFYYDEPLPWPFSR